MKTISLQAGDDFYSIAQDYLGSHQYWREIAAFNQMSIFDKLEAGAFLNIPSLKSAAQIANAAIEIINQVSDLAESDDLDLSDIKQPNTGDFSLVNWIL